MGLYKLYLNSKNNGLIDFIKQKPWSYIEFLVKEGSPEIEKYLPEKLDVLADNLPEDKLPKSETSKKLCYLRLMSHPFTPEVFSENKGTTKLNDVKKKALLNFALRGARN